MNLCMYQELKVIKEAVKKDLIFISDPFSFVTWNTCLHGVGIPSLTFIEGAEKRKDEYRFIVLYASGHGGMDSLDLTEEYEMPNIIDWLHEIVDILKIEQFSPC
ncbi:lipase [Bacillus tropicus]|uniref:lipase n=2 Tax=Bacillus tropicus TaxID=2026188 RepID=UPI003D1A5371